MVSDYASSETSENVNQRRLQYAPTRRNPDFFVNRTNYYRRGHLSRLVIVIITLTHRP